MFQFIQWGNRIKCCFMVIPAVTKRYLNILIIQHAFSATFDGELFI